MPKNALKSHFDDLYKMEELQKELETYLENNPNLTDKAKKIIEGIQLSIDNNDDKNAHKYLNKLYDELSNSPSHVQLGGHILKDLITVKEKVYKVHGLLLQSPSGNLYLYDPVSNDITFVIPTNAANVPRAVRSTDKDKKLTFSDASPPHSPPMSASSTVSTASTASAANTKISPTLLPKSTRPQPHITPVYGDAPPPLVTDSPILDPSGTVPKPPKNKKNPPPEPVRRPNLYNAPPITGASVAAIAASRDGQYDLLAKAAPSQYTAPDAPFD